MMKIYQYGLNNNETIRDTNVSFLQCNTHNNNNILIYKVNRKNRYNTFKYTCKLSDLKFNCDCEDH